MGFIKNLGKGFIRSSVNQVGRDYGRTISNDVFGDRHAIPHRSVNNSGHPVYVQTQPQQQHPQQLPVGGKFDIEPNFIVWILGCFAVPFVVSLLAFFVGMQWRERKSVRYTYTETQATYVRDMRYREGTRYNGDITMKKKMEIPVKQVDPAIVEQQRKNGDTLSMTGAVFFALWLVFFILVFKFGK